MEVAVVSSRRIVESIESEYRRYKALGEAAFEQLADDQLNVTESSGDNSTATLVRHISGNLTSRFTDFLTSDGEKPWRDRDAEFAEQDETLAAVRERWEAGWSVLFDTLGTLDDARLDAEVTIRGQRLTVLQALHRSLAHTTYHVGQIVFLAKSIRGEAWRNLSIPRTIPSSD
jgi:uncharacterized damage-inducible protein DinB